MDHAIVRHVAQSLDERLIALFAVHEMRFASTLILGRQPTVDKSGQRSSIEA
jgi:hypothetical protein